MGVCGRHGGNLTCHRCAYKALSTFSDAKYVLRKYMLNDMVITNSSTLGVMS